MFYSLGVAVLAVVLALQLDYLCGLNLLHRLVGARGWLLGGAGVLALLLLGLASRQNRLARKSAHFEYTHRITLAEYNQNRRQATAQHVQALINGQSFQAFKEGKLPPHPPDQDTINQLISLEDELFE
jgi:hypothetical protein